MLLSALKMNGTTSSLILVSTQVAQSEKSPFIDNFTVRLNNSDGIQHNAEHNIRSQRHLPGLPFSSP